MGKHKKARIDYLNKIEALERQYHRHLKKIKDAQEAGGFTSSMEREVRNFLSQKEKLRSKL